MFSKDLEVTIGHCYKQAREQRHEFMTVEHLLLALTENTSALSALRACGVDLPRLAADLQRIIAEQDDRGTWHVWFADAPEMPFVSCKLFSAIDYLATLFPGQRVDADALFLDDSRSNDRHCEFLGFAPRESKARNGSAGELATDDLLKHFAPHAPNES